MREQSTDTVGDSFLTENMVESERVKVVSILPAVLVTERLNEDTHMLDSLRFRTEKQTTLINAILFYFHRVHYVIKITKTNFIRHRNVCK